MVCLTLAADPKPSAQREADLQHVKPLWRLGDQWIVETTTLPIQVRDELTQTSRTRPIQWQFTVQRFEKAIDDCFRIEIRCLLSGPPQPVTTLWIDRQTQTLRQVQTQIPVAGEFRTVVENYETANGQPAPVLGMLTALPVDLPVFQGGQKGLQKYVYQSWSGPAGTKALGEIGFGQAVEQEVLQPQPEQVKSLLPEEFTKDLAERPVVEVRLKGDLRQVRQIWQAGRPWPVYIDNGTTICRLREVKAGAGPER
jgi:hypothetical protein